jgi:hypothetical protein
VACTEVSAVLWNSIVLTTLATFLAGWFYLGHIVVTLILAIEAVAAFIATIFGLIL